MPKKRLLVVGVFVVLSLACESPFQPEIPVEFPTVEPVFGWVDGIDPPNLLGVTNKGNLVSIDLTTGLASLVGDAGTHPTAAVPFELGWTSLTFGPGGDLYAVGRTNGDTRTEGCEVLSLHGGDGCSHLYTINPQNGQMIADLGPFGVAADGLPGIASVSDIAWGGGDWLGATRLVLTDDFLDEIGAGFLRATPDAVPPTSFLTAAFGDVGQVESIDPRGIDGTLTDWPGAGGIAYDAVNDDWWGVDNRNLSVIFRIDPVSGKAVTGSGIALILDGEYASFGFTGLTITAEGEAFANRGGDGLGGGFFEIYHIDLETGVLTTVTLNPGPGIQGSLVGITEGTTSAFTFESLGVQRSEISFDADLGDSFLLEGGLVLDPASDGIDLAGEDLTFRLGTFSQTILSSEFTFDGTVYRYTGTAPGLTLVEMTGLTFKIQGEGLDLPPGDVTEVLVGVQIGNDDGLDPVLFTLVGEARPRPTSLLLASTDRGEIVSLDLGAGTGSVIGRVLQTGGREIGWTGLAFAPNGNLFVSSKLESGDPSDDCTGVIIVGSFCAHLFVVEADSGYVFQDVGSTHVGVMSDLTFQSGTLYADYLMNDGPWDGGVATLDTETGASTHVARFGDLDGWPISNGGIAFDSETGRLWTVEDEFGLGRLIELDPVSGAVLSSTDLTLNGSGPLSDGIGGGFGFEGLEVLPGGFLVGVKSTIQGSSELYEIDTVSGAVTLLPMALPTLTGNITGIVFAEGINRTPKANAGPDQTHVRTAPGDFEVTLDGSLSFDPDGNSLAYLWSQDGVVFSTAVSPTYSFGVGTHVLTLSVEDAAGAIRTSQVTITIVNVAPVAVAGDDKTVATGSPVLLDGSGSTDLDGTIDSYEWLIDGAVEATGETPSLPLPVGVYSITLRVTDNNGAVHEDVVEVTVADRIEVSLQAGKDAFLTPGSGKNKNEGANPYLGLDDGGRIVVAFDLGDIDPQSITSATLVFTPDPSYQTRYWGASGGQIDAHSLLPDFPEGDAAHTYFDKRDEIEGNGQGVTWECRDDSNINNKKRNCSRGDRWRGGEFGTDATSSFLQLNDAYADLTFDVTADVLEGSVSWLVKQRDDDKSSKSNKSSKSSKSGKSKKSGKSGKSGDDDHLGQLRVFSREGASDPSLAPRLIIEYTPGA